MKRKKAIFFVLFGSDLGGVCVCVRVRACVRGRGGALLSLRDGGNKMDIGCVTDFFDN